MASKSVSKSVIWQLVGKFALQGIAFFATPIFTRILTPEDYGYTALYASWESILSLMIGLQTLKAIGNARIKYAPEKMAGFLSSIMTISVISFGILLIASIVFNDFFCFSFGNTERFSCGYERLKIDRHCFIMKRCLVKNALALIKSRIYTNKFIPINQTNTTIKLIFNKKQ